MIQKINGVTFFERDEELKQLISQVAALPHPKMDYTRMSPPDFAVINFIHRMFEIQASYVALLRSFAVMYQKFRIIPEPIAKYGDLPFEELVKWSRNYTRQHLIEAYTVYPHKGLMVLLLDLRIEGSFLNYEFARRLEQHKVGAEILLLEDGQDRLREFHKLLSVDRITSFNLREQSRKDIQQTAVETAWSAWSTLREKYTEDPYQPPEFPFDMLPEEKEFWQEMMINRVWKNGKPAHMKEMIALLTGETEAIPGIVHSRLKEDWRKIKRRKRILEGSPQDNLDLEHCEQINWSIIPEKSREGVLQQLREELHAEGSQEDTTLAQLDSEKAYHIAMKRWGKRGRIFLDALRQGHDLRAASAAAGVSRQTGHKYLTDLRKVLSEKKPSK